MLGKVLKYDVKNIGRQMVPIHILLGVCVLVSRLLSVLGNQFPNNNVIESMVSGSTVVSFCGIAISMIMLVVISIEYYQKNLFQDQGYLMHTLPVKAETLLNSKLLAVLCWSIITVAMAYIYVSVILGDFLWGKDGMEYLVNIIGEEKIKGFLLSTVMYVVSFYVVMICGAFAAITFGKGVQGGRGTLISVIIGGGMYFVVQTLAVIVEVIVMGIRYGFDAIGNEDFTTYGFPTEIMTISYGSVSVLYLIIACAVVVINYNRVKKHLNLA